MKAIVYKSQTDHTKRYAQMLSEELDLPVYDLGDAHTELEKGTPIIYLSWVKADDIVALPRVSREFDIKLIIAVGLTIPSDERVAKLKKRNRIKDKDLFSIRGGLTPDKIKGMERKMITMMAQNLTKSIEKKQRKGRGVANNEKETLHCLLNGGSYVEIENLHEITDHIKRIRKEVI